ncbi:MAG: hypothetical protein D8M57_18830 [Candidatus Scalindua sp. AMX11]|nr:MAG: hypothetical protein DWQ00_17565 [Candidatus Scalindua sp.]RZV71972.1 MAG: hypothetical protein EX341_14690 [Candidatus Scalindua sp. SCAELEC01]TDE63340.1 MAG: hypothetical protein D8M57_18830 [Candidatus Scalindua sp. AMX11]GJQ60036.1 MAG: hypothetical protein SCALA701_28370 [Candidatus Scalindua sp.]
MLHFDISNKPYLIDSIMKRHVTTVLLMTLSLIYSLALSELAWAANCEYCSEAISVDKRYCHECETKFLEDPTGTKAREEQFVNVLNLSREAYKKALADLSQFYLEIGYPNRLEQVRKEIKALNKIPEQEYLLIIEKPTIIKPTENVEEANILFEDGKMYKKSLNPINKKTNLNTAVKRFKKILDFYPESDLADDAAYELAEIFEGFFFQDYEVAAAYYIKCFELNPHTSRPARFMAATVYEDHLKDYDKAIQLYELALEMSKDQDLREKAQAKITELKKQEF